eukprot:767568-Pleurochrysis_carterae.AAC.1
MQLRPSLCGLTNGDRACVVTSSRSCFQKEECERSKWRGGAGLRKIGSSFTLASARSLARSIARCFASALAALGSSSSLMTMTRLRHARARGVALSSIATSQSVLLSSSSAASAMHPKALRSAVSTSFVSSRMAAPLGTSGSSS